MQIGLGSLTSLKWQLYLNRFAVYVIVCNIVLYGICWLGGQSYY